MSDEKKIEENIRAEHARLREEFDQDGRPGGDFYAWLLSRVDAEVVKAKEAEKWKGKKWKKKT